MKNLEKKYRENYGIATLKIKSNNVFGHFIEISKALAPKAPADFFRKQTLVNCERFSTHELSQLEEEVLLARDDLHRLERDILEKLLSQVSSLADEILSLSQTLGFLDVLSTFSWVALQEDMTRPEIELDRQIFQVTGAEHPLVRSRQQDIFVPHDLTLDHSRYFALITGPNMAGKTTVMREVAIIQFLAQIGSFVPARSARLSLCDYLFSRLGASDDILNGRSTFMVEMSETSSILRHATARSLIILDEVGRGTSTYDGMSIAWSLIEFFVSQVKGLCLFSTHYHELIDLVESLEGAFNLTVETVTQKGEVKFLYRLKEGGVQESFGLYVAKLAGLPPSVLERSQEILHRLEERTGESSPLCPPSFDVVSPPLSELETQLSSLDVMEMTPLEALLKLKEWQDLQKY